MSPEIRTTPLATTLLGLSTPHDKSKTFGQEIISLLDRVWPVLRKNAIPNKGINWVVYEPGCLVFAGVESDADPAPLGLESKRIQLARHAARKHVGPYRLLGQACAELKSAVEARGYRPSGTLIEVYGHWTEDESKLETDILLALE